ncbi:MAG: Rrf2 family transcriptional regulator [Bacteroidales bacterium]|nr:Rrf2 family transcriptional regulator [Candidatus Latescibacterota bacterium]
MHLSAQTRYGTRALIDLASERQDGPISVASIARRQDLSVKFLEQIMSRLKATSLVRVVRGRGYSLARDPRDISLNDILQALEVSEKVVHCLEPGKDCSREECCPTRRIWQGLDRVVSDYLAEFTLADLVAG